jgi:hypothetical protein
MRKVFLFIFIFSFFNLSTVKAEYIIEEKTNDYIIIKAGFNDHKSRESSRSMDIYQIQNDENNILNKTFRIAADHCSTVDKRSYMFFKNRTVDTLFAGQQKEFLFDHDSTSFFAKYRFFCADNEKQALSKMNSLVLNKDSWQNFPSHAALKQYENLQMLYLTRESEEVKRINLEKEIAIRQENEKKLQLVAIEEKKKEADIKRKKDLDRISSLEKDYGRNCSKHKKETDQFKNCLLEKEAKVKEADTKKIILQKEKEKQIADAEAKKIALQLEKERKINEIQRTKKQTEDAKIREEQIKVSKMKPDDRHAYTCSEKFSFRKGSDKFKDCIFELYKADAELEKLELQKQVAKANADAAKANAEAARAGAERQERLALAQTEAAKMQALAARQQAIAANTADSLALIESGLRMMSPQRPAPRMQTTCTYTGRFMNCF